MVILLALSMFIIILLEAPRLVRDKMWRELAAFSTILAVAYALAFLRVLGVKPLG